MVDAGEPAHREALPQVDHRQQVEEIRAQIAHAVSTILAELLLQTAETVAIRDLAQERAEAEAESESEESELSEAAELSSAADSGLHRPTINGNPFTDDSGEEGDQVVPEPAAFVEISSAGTSPAPAAGVNAAAAATWMPAQVAFLLTQVNNQFGL